MSEVTTKPKDEYYKMSEGEIYKKRGDKKNFQKMVKALKQLNIETTRKRKREEDTSLLLKNEQSVIQSIGKRKNSNSIVDSLEDDFDKIILDTSYVPSLSKKTKTRKSGGSKNKTKKNKKNSKKS
jgi:hypothetical protein